MKIEGEGRKEVEICAELLALESPGVMLVSEDREREREGEIVLLQYPQLICNRPISSASVPEGQLTNGGAGLKLGKTGREHAPRHADNIHRAPPPSLKSPIVIHGLPSERINFSDALSMLFVCSEFIFPHMKACRVVCLRAIRGYHAHYESINKRK